MNPPGVMMAAARTLSGCAGLGADVWRTMCPPDTGDRGSPRASQGGRMKVIDPVCKMTIEAEKAAATSEYKGQTLYFCAQGCKAKFDQAPGKYLGK